MKNYPGFEQIYYGERRPPDGPADTCDSACRIGDDFPGAIYDYNPQPDIAPQELAWLLAWFWRNLPLAWLAEKCGPQILRHFKKRGP